MFNANGVPLTLSVDTTSTDIRKIAYTAQLYVMTTYPSVTSLCRSPNQSPKIQYNSCFQNWGDGERRKRESACELVVTRVNAMAARVLVKRSQGDVSCDLLRHVFESGPSGNSSEFAYTRALHCTFLFESCTRPQSLQIDTLFANTYLHIKSIILKQSCIQTHFQCALYHASVLLTLNYVQICGVIQVQLFTNFILAFCICLHAVICESKSEISSSCCYHS